MLHREEIINKITEMLRKASTEDLKIFLIIIEGYLRKKR